MANTLEETAILETGKGKVLVGEIRFEYNPATEKFNVMSERFDNYWTELRNRLLRKVANHEKLDVRFEE